MLSSWSNRLNDTPCNVLALLRDLNAKLWHMMKFFNSTYIFADNGKTLKLKKISIPFLIVWTISRHLFDIETTTITQNYCLSLKLFPIRRNPSPILILCVFKSRFYINIFAASVNNASFLDSFYPHSVIISCLAYINDRQATTILSLSGKLQKMW